MKRQDKRSAEALAYRKLYNTARWHRTRTYQLRYRPLCENCKSKGYVVQATVCHHVQPEMKANPETFFAGPFLSLCSTCHDGEFQQIEKLGYSTAVGADGWPTDGAHPANLTSRSVARGSTQQ